MAQPTTHQPRGLYPGLFIGVLAVSVAALFIRLADAPALTIAAYRLAFASLPLALFTSWRKRSELVQLWRVDRGSAMLSGICLAGHFATWVASLSYVSVASSVALVTTSPFFVAAFAFLFSAERTSRRMLLAICVCALGGVVIGAADFGLGAQALLGDGLALTGAAFAAAYFALGRQMRARVSVSVYISAVYTIAAVSLLTATVALQQPLIGFAPRTWLMFLLLALVPQLLGHSALNWALGYLSAPFVAIAVLGEPVLATLLAALFLAERPGLERVAGGALILAGVYLAMREERSAPMKEAAEQMATELL